MLLQPIVTSLWSAYQYPMAPVLKQSQSTLIITTHIADQAAKNEWIDHLASIYTHCTSSMAWNSIFGHHVSFCLNFPGFFTTKFMPQLCPVDVSFWPIPIFIQFDSSHKDMQALIVNCTQCCRHWTCNASLWCCRHCGCCLQRQRDRRKITELPGRRSNQQSLTLNACCNHPQAV